MEEHKEKKDHHKKEGTKEIRISIPEVKGLNWNTITTAAVAILLVIVLFQAYQARALIQKISAVEAKAVEENKLPSIEVTGIEAEGCDQCTPLAEILATINPSAWANITKQLTLTASDEQSKTLIREYSIKKLPAIVVKGEIDKIGLGSGFTRTADALISIPQPPYVDAATGAVKGLVSLTYVNASSCTECTDLMPAAQNLRSVIMVKGINVVDKDSPEGKALVKKYSMARLPGILISNDVAEYQIASQIAIAGTLEQDGTIAIGANPPYLNISTGKVDGIAGLIMLNDSSCTTCYDVTMHMPIVKRFQVYLSSTRTVDSSSAEGKALISKYKITAVPMILLTGDVSVYAQLNAIWNTVGTVESDGTYIFRAMSAIPGSPYKNLTTGKVEANAAAQAGQ